MATYRGRGGANASTSAKRSAAGRKGAAARWGKTGRSMSGGSTSAKRSVAGKKGAAARWGYSSENEEEE